MLYIYMDVQGRQIERARDDGVGGAQLQKTQSFIERAVRSRLSHDNKKLGVVGRTASVVMALLVSMGRVQAQHNVDFTSLRHRRPLLNMLV